MKILAAVVALLIAGGGYYLYTEKELSYDRGDDYSENGAFGTENAGSDIANNNVGTTESASAPRPDAAKKKNVIFSTNKGEIELELWDGLAPTTVENFRKLVAAGFYDGTRFHRVIKDFMIQGGDPLSKDPALRARWGTGGPGYSFADELNGEKLVRGVIAMANAGPDTNGSQFFIITAASTPWLDGKHTGFGRVVRGMDVVSAIENVPVGQNDQPAEDIVVQSVRLE